MALQVWVESTFSMTPWYVDFCTGIKTAATARRLKPEILITEVPLETCSAESMVFLLGETMRWFETMMDYLARRDIPSCMVTCGNSFLPSNVSSITNAHARDMANLLRYMKHYSRQHAALFGFNPSSPADYQRLEGAFYDSERIPEDDIYYLLGSVEELADKLIKRIDQYDSIITGNDVYAIYLIGCLRKAGIRVPEDVYVASFGNIILGNIVTPSVSSMSVDLKQMANVAISAYAGWQRNAWGANFSFVVESAFYARQSTDYLKMPHNSDRVYGRNIVELPENYPDHKSSYTNDSLYFISTLNNFIQKADTIDVYIIQALLEETPFDTVAERLFLSKRGLDYRLFKIYRLFRVSSRKNLKDLLQAYSDMICFDDLVKAKADFTR